MRPPVLRHYGQEVHAFALILSTVSCSGRPIQVSLGLSLGALRVSNVAEAAADSEVRKQREADGCAEA
jgi:hypothetical protein